MATINTFFGYNPLTFAKTVRELNNAFNDFEDAFIKVTQSQFVNPIAQHWCCPEAVNYFQKNFKTSFDSLNNTVYKTFQEIHSEICNAGNLWARRTQKSWGKVPFSVRKLGIDVSGIKSQTVTGGVGIDAVKAVSSAAALMGKTYVKVSAALTKAESAVVTSGLLGSTQEEALKNKIRSIREKVSEMITTLLKTINKNIIESAEK